MTHSIDSYSGFSHSIFDPRLLLASAAVMLIATVLAFAQISVTPENTVIVDDARDMDVYAFGKSVIVRNQAKGVLALGGDVIVEGKVYGDVAIIGGSVIQKEGAYIGGDVIIFGGKYQADDASPLREAGRETVMYVFGYEDELRKMSQDPATLFAPNLSLTFLAQRILSILFWFGVSVGLATIAPGAVSRAIARFHLSGLKIVAIGVVGFLLTTMGVIGSLTMLPNYLSAVVGLMAFFLLMLTYVFGRVALHVTVGKLIQKRFLGENNRSETLAILIGVVAWTLLLSIPYVWTVALFVLFAAGIGLVLTAQSQREWLSR